MFYVCIIFFTADNPGATLAVVQTRLFTRIVASAGASVVFIVLSVTIICFICIRRRIGKADTQSDDSFENNEQAASYDDSTTSGATPD